VGKHEPDAVVVDVRMPPTFTDEGLRAALVVRQRWPQYGQGLAGLADRLAGVDGRLSVRSPAGGPTVIEAELPCGS